VAGARGGKLKEQHELHYFPYFHIFCICFLFPLLFFSFSVFPAHSLLPVADRQVASAAAIGMNSQRHRPAYYVILLSSSSSSSSF
jgi:hypothetical protein